MPIFLKGDFMAKLNTKQKAIFTHEGVVAQHVNPELNLRRSVMSCLLWEDGFYEDGQSIADRINDLVEEVSPEKVMDIAIEARSKMKLRHVPLLIAREMSRLAHHKTLVAATLEGIIQRPDELAEFMAIYWREKKEPLSAQVKKGLARAFTKFNEYSLAKYNRDGTIKLRDVLFLCHAKPSDPEQAKVWKKLVDGDLAVPDTWEVALSSGDDKKKSWERLLKEEKLGALALLRNLRNMKEVGVDEKLVLNGLDKMKVERVLPFRFITAARYAPQWEPYLEKAMFKCLAFHKKLKGKTAIVIDNSGSMSEKLSAKSELTRADAACALAILLREICDDVLVIAFSNDATIIPARRGFALAEAIKRSPSGGTNTQTAINLANKEGYDRIIVVSDEQSHQSIGAPLKNGYFINVASNKNGIGYGAWTHIDGFSEAVIDYIQAFEEAL